MLNKNKIKGTDLDFYYPIDDAFCGPWMVQGLHEAYQTALLLIKVDESTFFLDIGAHYGYYSLLVADKLRNMGCAPKIHVHAFEPVLLNYLILEKNVRENNLQDYIQVHNLAVSHQQGRTQVYQNNVNHGNAQLVNYDQRVQCETVDKITIDSFLAGLGDRYCPSLVKIDTEGHDLRVLEGMRSTLAKCGRPLTVFVEVCSFYLRHFGNDAIKLYCYLREYFNTIKRIDEERPTLREFGMVDAEEYTYCQEGQLITNLYCSNEIMRMRLVTERSDNRDADVTEEKEEVTDVQDPASGTDGAITQGQNADGDERTEGNVSDGSDDDGKEVRETDGTNANGIRDENDDENDVS